MKDINRKLYELFLNNNFLPADSKSHSIIKNFNADNHLYEMTACLIVTWSDEYNTLYKIINGFFCFVQFYPNGSFAFLINRPFLLNDNNELQQVVDTLFDSSLKIGIDTIYIKEVEERFLNDFKYLKGYYINAVYDNNMSEYIFNAQSILEMRGSKNEEKRRQMRRFADNADIVLEPITKENFNQCIEIEKTWCDSHVCEECKSFVGCARKTTLIMADIFDGIVYQGFLGYVNGKPAGYIIFERESEENAYFYFAKSTISNFSMHLYYNTIQNHLSSCKRINLGADVGKSGLRLFKRRLGEFELQKKYLLTIKREK